MNRRLAPVAAAAVAVAGAVTAVVPQHAASLVLLAATTVLVVLALFLLVLAGPLVTAESPRTALDRGSASCAAPALDPQGLRDARRDLGQRHRSGQLPRAVRERLVAAARLRLQHRGIDLDAPGGREQAQALLGSATWALLADRPAPGSTVAPAATAATVHRTLDELDELVTPSGGTHDRDR